MLRSGINADAIDIEGSEKGGRTEYDAPNPKLSARRSMIYQQTARIVEVNEMAEAAALDIKVNNVGREDAQNELTKLVSRRDLLSSE